jgi:hypothetical protein
MTTVLLILALTLILYFAVPRSGAVTGRTSLLPGCSVAFRNTSNRPLLSVLPITTIRWRGYRFEFALVHLSSGVCRAYIVSQPGYLGQASGLGSTHRLSDSLGRKYVCWNPEPRDADQMAAVLALWVAATCRYRETGVFPDARQAAQELSRS